MGRLFLGHRVASALFATPSHVTRGDLLLEPLATHGHEWLRFEGCLVLSPPRILLCQNSNLVGPTAKGVLSALLTTPFRAIRGHIPLRVTRDRIATDLRSHTSRVTLANGRPTIADFRARARLPSCSPADAIRDRRLRGPTSRMAPLVKDHVPSHGRIFHPQT
jgi:hypothetical protein